MKNCGNCSIEFELSQLELDLLKKLAPVVGGESIEIPQPRLCPLCRRQRRYMFRNDMNLYKRKCEKTGKMILSVFSAEKEFPVYSQGAWWAEDWNAKDYGRDFDFGRSFFEQFAELMAVVPRVSSVVVQSENCDYTAFTLTSRNCFLSSRLADAEDVYYSYLVWNSNNCFDCYNLSYSELCYECIDCVRTYHCFYTERSKNSNDLWFCADMIGCKDCFGCIGLVQKQYCFFNEQLTKEEYAKRVDEIDLEEAKLRFAEHRKKFPVRAVNVLNSEKIHGSNIFDSKNVYASFDIVGCEDAIHCTQSEHGKDIMDTDFAYKAELCYEQLSNGTSRQALFCFVALSENSEITYCIDVYNSTQNCFGCISMKKGRYCILNKQYSKEEYEELVPKIIEHMKKHGEWGEWFSHELSPLGYNESVAQDLLPMTKEEVLAKGWKWYEAPEESLAQAEGENVVKCEVTERSFRLIPKELEFYKINGLPNPRRHPDQRHSDRLSLRNPYFLKESVCEKCGVNLLTDQSEDKVIYCEKCYLAEVY